MAHTQPATNNASLLSNCLLQRQTQLTKFDTCQLHISSCFATQLSTLRLPAGQVEAQLADVQPLIDAARTAVGGIKADNINEVGYAKFWLLCSAASPSYLLKHVFWPAAYVAV
jgi:hypothetical protein